MNARTVAAICWSLLFLECIVAANQLTSNLGMVPVGFGLVATAGTYLAGLTFVVRDLVQDAAGKLTVIGLILVGAAASAALADGRIALASGVAFLLSELVDFAVYTPLRRAGWIRAAVASNVVGSIVDTFVFLAIAGFPIWSSVPGQLVGKLTITAIVVAAVALVRALLRHDVVTRRA